LEVNAVYINSLDKIVINLRDITDIRNLEKIKRDFVVNVSHELRTPLTAIKGYLETIRVKGDDRHYLEIVKRHTDRLIRIVEDLLTLSELEEKGIRLENEDVDLKAIVENVVKMFEQKIKEKELGIKIIVEDDLPLVTGDSFKLEQVFINIIDNAIKYTDKGEVIITLRREDGYVRAEVKDTGIGIPEKHLSRIFERFYTVDKSHSRRLGGTGLGLSIVKHIVSLHGGRVDVSSKPGGGTVIGFEIPILTRE
jgi:two-component system phosphate regulon sensor histidine kinase PhoR